MNNNGSLKKKNATTFSSVTFLNSIENKFIVLKF